MNEDLEVRFRTIEELQRRRDRSKSNTWNHESADYAIDLALGDQRVIDEYLTRNCVRDASRSLARKAQKNRERGMTSLNNNFEMPVDDEMFDGWAPDALIDQSDPESILIAQEARDNLYAEFEGSALDRHCLTLLEHGYSKTEVAQQLGVSDSTVKRAKRRICGRAAVSLEVQS